MEIILNWLITFTAVYLGCFLNRQRGGTVEVENPKMIFNKNATNGNAEFLEPLTEEQYEKIMDEESGRGELTRKIIKNMPWNFRRQKFLSSDSSTSTK